MKKPKVRLGYLVSHPIQYQAPLLREIAQIDDIELTVFFRSDISIKEYQDHEFGVNVLWDIDLLSGYKHIFLPKLFTNKSIGFFSPINFGVLKFLQDSEINILWIHGWGSWTNIYVIFCAKLLKIPVLIRGESSLLIQKNLWIKQKIKDHFLKFLFKYIKIFLAIGSANKEFYLHYGVKQENIFDMPYAVDNHRIQQVDTSFCNELRDKLKIDSNRKVLLYVGKLTKRKRVLDLMWAYINLIHEMSELRLPYLVIVGDGECMEELKKLQLQHNLEGVRIVGFKNQTELPAYFHIADIFIIPSIAEPWGLVLNEAMCCQCAIIASDEVVAAKDLVQNGINGYIFKAGNVADLKYKLSKIISDSELISAMGQNSAKLISKWSFTEDIKAIKDVILYLETKSEI
jgi:glycosyltransferase involved in cell wall biosynthesis